MTRKYILIISTLDDVHALAVKREIETISNAKTSAVIFDSANFPTLATLNITLDSWQLKISPDLVLTNKNVLSIWWRRPSRHKIDPGIIDASARKFSENEATHAFDTLVYWRDDYLVINPSEKELIANRKSVQLAVANKLGFRTPKTLITNNPSEAAKFSQECPNGAIYKTLTAPISVFGETRRYSNALEDFTSSISLAPIIFQEEVEKNRDIRVTVIGDEIFATWIEVRNPTGQEYPDWRLDVTAKAHKIKLSNNLAQKIRALMSELSLEYGAIDLIEDCKGEFYFLEINPSGQFLFNEIDTGEGMALAFAKLLLRENKIQASILPNASIETKCAT